ncbi:hypothetical protein [Hymenobacter negativus]|uniref:Uncharacterized protein n=1 Tax=Hymenobacter negativus TaxID=2795026 RepID=A0ABS0QBA1_9BACT|nr:hypothetical protein [Hymenobacter negativus]MBH8559855.1 hypothetical protein [Hymenobacter negativus]
MNPQLSNLIIPIVSLLGSVAVVLISTWGNLKSKSIDVKEKFEDRKQELRKIYISRKLDAGEAIIGRYTQFIQQLDLFNSYLAFVNSDKPNVVFEYGGIDISIQAENLLALSLYNEKNHSYFYYNNDSTNDRLENIITQHNLVLRILAGMIATKTKADGTGSANANDDILKEALPQYLSLNRMLRELLGEIMQDIRNETVKYDIPT